MRHLPWAVAVLLVALLLVVQGLFLLPREVESARAAATGAIRASFARDLSVIQTQVLLGNVTNVQDFVSASAALPGLEEMTLIDPEGEVLASTEIALEGQAVDAVAAPLIRVLASELNQRFEIRVREEPTSRKLELAASLSFPSESPSLRGPAHGLLYQRRDLIPILQPIVQSSRDFIAATSLLVLLLAVPLQWFVYRVVTRRLQRLARDVARFGDGTRTGLFVDEWNDDIGRISGLLREVTQTVRDREEADQRLALALNSANAGIWDWHMDGNVVHTSGQYHAMFGDEAKECAVPADELLDRIHPEDQRNVRDQIRRLHEPGTDSYQVEFRMRAMSSNTYLWIRSTGRVVERAADGSAMRMLGQHVDISEQRALQARESDLARIVDESLNEIYVISAEDHRFLHVNRAACANLGYTREELFAMAPPDLNPEIDGQAFVQLLDLLRSGSEGIVRREGRHRRKDGSTYETEFHLQNHTYQGAPAFVCMVLDITARREQERALHASEARILKFFEGVNHSISVFDRECRFVMLNQVAAKRLGAETSEIVGHSIDQFVPNVKDRLSQRIAAVLEDGQLREWEDEVEVRGEVRWFQTVLQPMEDDNGNPTWALLTAYEITERKRSQEEVRAQEARYRTLVESTSTILWEADPETFQMFFVNQEAESVLGYPPEEWVGTPDFWQSHIHPSDRERVIACCRESAARCEGFSIEYRMIRADGTTVWLRDLVNVIPKDERAWKIVGAMTDITREKREEERFQAAFESIPIGNLVVDEEGTILLANPAAQEMFGYERPLPVGKSMSRLIPDVPWEFNEVDAAGGRAGWLDKLGAMKEYVGYRENGDSFPVRLAVGEIHSEGARTYVCSVIDLSHVKSLEAQLAQAQRMEAVGQLAGGIAHDFNNLLHVINGFVEIARQSQAETAPVQRELEQIALAGKRAASLTSQLLAFSRRQVMKPENIDLNAVITRTAAMLGRVIGEHIKLDVIPNPRLALVYADQGMIEQVLMNLCVNARDAMPDGGVLSIETENVVINGTYTQDHVWAKPGRYVLMTITDTGVGMDDDTVNRVFEPFFTTKAMHEGTGLGLSTVYGIVKQHGGMINVYSEVGKGTTFKIYMPQVERLATDVGTKIEGAIPTGSETILVVEDDEAVRRLTRAILEGAGYQVIEAADGRKAVHCFREKHTEIHLVLLDVVMPDMGGREALDEMVKISPNLKALFASGYSEKAIHTNFVLDKGLSLLKKPYSRSDLLRTIRQLLDQEDGSTGNE